MIAGDHITIRSWLDLPGGIGPDGGDFGGSSVAASAYSNLREFMDRLEREGRLVRVAEPVSTQL
jgi:hypothetical protein